MTDISDMLLIRLSRCRCSRAIIMCTTTYTQSLSISWPRRRGQLSTRHNHIDLQKSVLNWLVFRYVVTSVYNLLAKAMISFSTKVLILSHSQSWAHVGSKKDSGSCDRLLQMEPVTLTLNRSKKVQIQNISFIYEVQVFKRRQLRVVCCMLCCWARRRIFASSVWSISRPITARFLQADVDSPLM